MQLTEQSAYDLGFSLNDNNDFEEVDINSIEPSLVWHFIRGYFEGNGATINDPRTSVTGVPVLNFFVSKAAYLEKVCTFINIPYTYSYSSKEGKGSFQITGTNSLDLLGKLYDTSGLTTFDVHTCKYNAVNRMHYIDWCRYGISFYTDNNLSESFAWCKTREDAVAPSKSQVSDSGYDLTIIDKVKSFNSKTTLYTTGIKVKPPFGWYIDVVPRSSIIKTGYMLANNVGIIDRAYTGEIMIALIKVDDTAPDLELPCRIAQMIPRRIGHFKFEQVDDIERTIRNDGGFGSTGK